MTPEVQVALIAAGALLAAALIAGAVQLYVGLRRQNGAIQKIHVMVNSRSNEQDKRIEKQDSRIDQLTRALTAAGIVVPDVNPEDLDPPNKEE